MRTPLLTGIGIGLGIVAAAPAVASDASITAPGALTTAAPSSGWANSGRIGIFFSDVTDHDAQTSRDPTISNAHSSEAWLTTVDDSLLWRRTGQSVDQNLRLRYGRIRTQGSPWQDNTDEVHYDGVYRRELGPHPFLYGANGVDSVFRNSTDHHPLDPVTAKASVGVGAQAHDLLLEGDPAHHDEGGDRLEVRLGVRAQRRWSRLDLPAQDRIEIGPEGFARYDRPIDKTLRWFVQDEIFTQFDDIHHLMELVTAGLTAQLSRFVSLDVAFRAYRERQPRSVPSGQPGYDQWGMTNDTLLGLTISY